MKLEAAASSGVGLLRNRGGVGGSPSARELSARSPAPKPDRLTPPPSYERKFSLPVALVSSSAPSDTPTTVPSGIPFVRMSTPPPVKSPERFGVNVLVTVILAAVPGGKGIIWTR